MSVKLRDEMWGYELAIAAIFFLINVIGMAVCLVGVYELPRCTYGELECYFFKRVCGESYFNMANAPYTCAWVAKRRAIESSDGDGVEQLVLPIMAAIISLIPGISMIVATVIRNERCMLGMLEGGKSFLIFDALLLAISDTIIHSLTFDCRYYTEMQHGNSDKCDSGYVKYVAGSIIIMMTQILLLVGIITFGEMERRRVRSDGIDSFGPADIEDLRTDAVPMNIRVSHPPQQPLA